MERLLSSCACTQLHSQSGDFHGKEFSRMTEPLLYYAVARYLLYRKWEKISLHTYEKLLYLSLSWKRDASYRRKPLRDVWVPNLCNFACRSVRFISFQIIVFLELNCFDLKALYCILLHSNIYRDCKCGHYRTRLAWMPVLIFSEILPLKIY